MKKKAKAKVFLLLLGLLFLIFISYSQREYYFDPFSGIYFKYPKSRDLGEYKIQKGLQSNINIIIKYRPKGMVFDYSPIRISRGNPTGPAQRFNMPSFCTFNPYLTIDNIPIDNLIINNKPAKEYHCTPNSGVIVVTDPKITVNYNLVNGQSHISHDFIVDFIKSIKTIY